MKQVTHGNNQWNKWTGVKKVDTKKHQIPAYVVAEWNTLTVKIIDKIRVLEKSKTVNVEMKNL